MADRVVPMIHVPDVRATVEWYRSIGFTVADTFGNGFGGLSFAILSFGMSQVMFNQGGESSPGFRREVDLYVYTEKVDDLFRQIKDRVEIVESPHDTFYGMREFIIRDLNRFWITFGQTSASEVLMQGVLAGNAGAVRVALDETGLTPEILTAALIAASTGACANVEIAGMLKLAGAQEPPDVDGETLQSHAGEYEGDNGLRVSVIFKDATLFAALAGQPPVSLIAVDKTTFRVTALDTATVTFNVVAEETAGFSFSQGSTTTQLRRIRT